ncbi:MAG: hypothetical protein ACK5HY_02785, partial [Parahaliea sp.]
RMAMLNRLGLHKLLARIDSAPVAAAPALVAIVGPAEKDDILAAGRLLQRSWQHLNAQGVATHPYYVISDQLARLQTHTVPQALTTLAQQIKTRSEALLGLTDGERIHMLLRTGYPRRENPPQSLRLPLESVFTNLTGQDVVSTP